MVHLLERSAAAVVPLFAGAYGLHLRLEVHDRLVGIADGGERLVPEADHRILRGDRRDHLLVLPGAPPEAGRALSAILRRSGRVLRTRPLLVGTAVPDRDLLALVWTMLDDIEPSAERDWRPLAGLLSAFALQAGRADHSVPVGDGIGLVVDGDLGVQAADLRGFALAGRELRAATVATALDPATGRSVVFASAPAPRLFVGVGDDVVDVSCPRQASRTRPASDPLAPPLATSEADLLLTLAGAVGTVAGDAEPLAAWLPPRWRWTERSGAGRIEVAGVVRLDRALAVFLTVEAAIEPAERLVLRGVGGPDRFPLREGTVLAAFHADEADETRLELAVVLADAPSGGVVRVGLAGEDVQPRWIRLLEPASGAAADLVRRFAPPDRDLARYAAALAAPTMPPRSAEQPILARLSTGHDGPPAPAGIDIVVVAEEARAEAVRTSLAALFLTLPRPHDLTVALPAGPGFEAAARGLAGFAAAFGASLSIVAVRAGAGLAPLLAAARRGDGPLVAVAAGRVPRSAGWAAALLAEAAADALMLPPLATGRAGRPGAVALVGAGRALLDVVDPRLSSLGGLAEALAAAAGGSVSVAATPDLAFAVAAAAEPESLPLVADRLLLATAPRAAVAVAAAGG